jgi:predicted HTH transcriptional regulator
MIIISLAKNETFTLVTNLKSTYTLEIYFFRPLQFHEKNMSKDGRHIEKLILEGEHIQQDFKFAINDSKKIARTIAAFANTQGGRLLLGVKDNGSIAGVRTDEEYYMIEAAASLYCKPPVPFEFKEYHINGKTVLEITIQPSALKPHSAPNKDGIYKVYIRVADKNLLANSVLLKVWRRQMDHKGTFISMAGPEKFLLDYLRTHESITKSKFCKLAQISSFKGEKVLVNLVSMNLLKMTFTEQQVTYSLSNMF